MKTIAIKVSFQLLSATDMPADALARAVAEHIGFFVRRAVKDGIRDQNMASTPVVIDVSCDGTACTLQEHL